MASRRTHTKSRNGCTNCKRRKVKCDEAYPVCFNCRRHNVSCSLSVGYGDEPPEPSRASRFGTSSFLPDNVPTTPASNSGSADTPSPSNLANFCIPLGSDHILPCPPHELWSYDIELMHHWCTVTAPTLAIRHDAVHVWQVIMPQEGYRNSYVMHGLLAMAAVHKAYVAPNRKKLYLALSDYHQTLGSEGFRPQLAKLSRDNWSAIFAFASSVPLYMMCLPSRCPGPRLEDPIVNMLELMNVIRGLRTMLIPFLPRIYHSKYAPFMLGTWLNDEDSVPNSLPSLEETNLPVDIFDALQRLREFQKMDIPSICEQHYEEAVERLERSVKLIAAAGVHAECTTVLAWPYVIHESIMVDIQMKKPHALLLLAYFGILFGAVEKPFWYARGWVNSIVDEAERLLIGQQRFLDLLEWPQRKAKEMYGLR